MICFSLRRITDSLQLRISAGHRLITWLRPPPSRHRSIQSNTRPQCPKLLSSALLVRICSRSLLASPDRRPLSTGGIGQPLALLLKANPLVTEVRTIVMSPDMCGLICCDQLGLYDIVNTPGVAADLSHIATPAKVEGYLPKDDGLQKTLTGADIVVIPAGVPRKPGVSARNTSAMSSI